MRNRLRNLGLLSVALLWLLLMSFPVFAFVLANRGQVQFGGSNGAHVRIFLLQESESQGLGVEWTRSAGAEGCHWSSVYYLLWEKGPGAESVSFCQCLDPSTGAVVAEPECGSG